MKTNNNTSYANALILGTLLLIFTMVMHPTGGSIAYVQKISTLLMVTHSVAILSLPLLLLGFWGLYKLLDDDSLSSLGAYMVIVIGLFAGMLAAAVNGLALPIFLAHFPDAGPEQITTIKPIVSYNAALNHAFDFIFMGACCVSTMLWSIAILRTRRLPVWMGWLGLLLPILAIIPACLGFAFTGLAGFRFFMAGYFVWLVMIIIGLRSSYK